MSEKHSPGRWHWQGLGRDGAPVLYAFNEDGTRRRLAKGAVVPPLSEADARLISAAPELLDALVAILARKLEDAMREDIAHPGGDQVGYCTRVFEKEMALIRRIEEGTT